MKITRATRRADGLTVGEAMDRDAAFLRSVGIPAQDGQPTLDEKREAFQEKVRQSVLAALDSNAHNEKAWTDSDLPALFKAIDPIADRLFDKQDLKLN